MFQVTGSGAPQGLPARLSFCLLTFRSSGSCIGLFIVYKFLWETGHYRRLSSLPVEGRVLLVLCSVGHFLHLPKRSLTVICSGPVSGLRQLDGEKKSHLFRGWPSLPSPAAPGQIISTVIGAIREEGRLNQELEDYFGVPSVFTFSIVLAYFFSLKVAGLCCNQ